MLNDSKLFFDFRLFARAVFNCTEGWLFGFICKNYLVCRHLMIGSKGMADLVDENNGALRCRSYPVIWLSLSLIIFLLVFFQIPGEAPDWQSYDRFFNLLLIDGLDVLVTSRAEPGFVIVSFFLTELFSSNLAVFGVIAASAIFLKCWAINQFSSSRLVFLVIMLFYLIRFAPLHELTQVRAACSTSFMVIAFVLSWRGNRIGGVVACAAALAFHLCAIIIIPLVLLLQLRSRFTQALSLKTVITVSVVVFITTLFAVKPAVNYLQDSFMVIAMYQAVGFGYVAPNPFSAALLLDWGMIIGGLVMWGRLPSMMKYVLLLEIIGMAIFYASMDFAVIAHRYREYFAVLWVFFVAQGLQQRTPVKEVSILFVIASIALYSYLFFFSGKFFS